MRRLLKKQLDRSFVFQRFKEELKTEYGTEKAAVIWRYAERVLQKMETNDRFPR